MTPTASRSAAVALSSAALMGLSALAIPGVAGAADVNCDPATSTYEVTGGSVQWGVKQSFRSYLMGPIAHGGWTVEGGAEFAGAERGPDGRFIWPIAKGSGAVTTAGAATASGAGSVTMHGHDDVLGTTLSDPTVAITGTQGELKLDYRAKKAESFTAGSPFVWVEGEQVTAVKFALPAARDFHRDGTTTITTGATTLETGFNEALGGIYEAGSTMDPVTLVLEIAQTCAVDPGDDDGQGTVPDGILGSLGSVSGILGS